MKINIEEGSYRVAVTWVSANADGIIEIVHVTLLWGDSFRAVVIKTAEVALDSRMVLKTVCGRPLSTRDLVVWDIDEME